MKGSIYQIKCKDINIDDFYIGSSINITRRHRQHKYNSKRPKSKEYHRKVYDKIRKEKGWDNWEIEILLEIDVNGIEELHDIEKWYIQEFSPSLNKLFI